MFLVGDKQPAVPKTSMPRWAMRIIGMGFFKSYLALYHLYTAGGEPRVLVPGLRSLFRNLRKITINGRVAGRSGVPLFILIPIWITGSNLLTSFLC